LPVRTKEKNDESDCLLFELVTIFGWDRSINQLKSYPANQMNVNQKEDNPMDIQMSVVFILCHIDTQVRIKEVDTEDTIVHKVGARVRTFPSCCEKAAVTVTFSTHGRLRSFGLLNKFKHLFLLNGRFFSTHGLTRQLGLLHKQHLLFLESEELVLQGP
jgi:hypothetical protein